MSRKKPTPQTSETTLETTPEAALETAAAPGHQPDAATADASAQAQVAPATGATTEAIPMIADGIEREVYLSGSVERGPFDLPPVDESVAIAIVPIIIDDTPPVDLVRHHVHTHGQVEDDDDEWAQAWAEVVGPLKPLPDTTPDTVELEPLPDKVELGDGRVLYATTAGLPNTCSVTGVRQTDRWFAVSTQAARAGMGVSEEAVRELIELIAHA